MVVQKYNNEPACSLPHAVRFWLQVQSCATAFINFLDVLDNKGDVAALLQGYVLDLLKQ
jgi:hypothetical protein